jgi:hypothetical protein
MFSTVIRLCWCLVLGGMVCFGTANDQTGFKNRVVRKIRIQSADPALVIGLLRGDVMDQPEYSTLNKK